MLVTVKGGVPVAGPPARNTQDRQGMKRTRERRPSAQTSGGRTIELTDLFKRRQCEPRRREAQRSHMRGERGVRAHQTFN